MKLAFQLGSLSAINLGVTFLSQWYVLTIIGPGFQTDALFAGMSIPQLALSVMVGSLIHVLIPLLSGESESNLRHDAWAFLGLITSVFSVMALILFLTASWWVPLTVPGFSEAGKSLTVHLTQIQLIGMVFAAINSVQWATYHARQKFLWAELAPILASIFSLIVLVWALPLYGVIAAAWVSTLRLGLQVLFLAPGMGMPLKPNFKSAATLRAWHRIRPLLIGTSYFKSETLIDRFLLSSAFSGSLSLYYLAQQIYSAANQVLNKAISVPLVPYLSRLHKAKNLIEFQRVFRRKLLLVNIICLVGFILFSIAGEHILNLLFGHGNLNAKDIIFLYWLLIWLGGMFLGGALGQIASGAFYAEGNTKTPTMISVITYTIYIPAKIIVFKYYSVEGLALLMSVYYLVDFILLYIYQRKFLIQKWEKNEK